MALAIARGEFWYGKRVHACPVIYVTLEGEAGLQNRLKAWVKHWGLELPANFFAIVQPLNLLEPSDVSDLIAVLPKGCVVFIDTLNRAAPGADENSSVDMGKIIAALKQIVDGADALVIPIHHTGKDQSKGLRGHSSLYAALDGAIEVERTASGRSFRAAKVKDGDDGEKNGFRLDVVALGFDEDGDAVTSCVVVPEEVIFKRPEPQGKGQRAVLGALRAIAPLTFEEAIVIAGPLATKVKSRERAEGKRTLEGLLQGGYLKATGSNLQDISLP